MLDGAHVARWELAAVGRTDSGDGGLFKTDPAPLDEHRDTLRLVTATSTITVTTS
jgi:hypothetical protein